MPLDIMARLDARWPRPSLNEAASFMRLGIRGAMALAIKATPETKERKKLLPTPTPVNGSCAVLV